MAKISSLIYGLFLLHGAQLEQELQRVFVAESYLFNSRVFFIYLSFLLLGFCFLFFFKRNILNISAYLRVNYCAAGLSGILGLFLTPFIVMALLGSLLGVFLFPAFIFMYCLLLFFAFYSAALLIGEMLARIFTFRDHLYLEMLLGTTVLFFSVFIPFIGSFFFIFFLLLGLGGGINMRFGTAD